MDTEDSFEEEEEEPVPRGRTRRIVINLSKTQYEVVKDVARSPLHWRISYKEEDDNWDVFWLDTGMTPERLMHMKPYQKINHFPGMYTLARKNTLANNLNNMKKLFPAEYNFFPATWVLPHDAADFHAQFNEKRAKTFIVKPEASCQGQGIFLTRNYEQINPSDRYVVQRYLHKPLLLDGLKFDLRVYVLLAGCEPLRIFVHEEGLARFATETYVAPVRSNLTEMCMHLTNYAINKSNPNFVFNDSEQADDVGHKKSLTALMRMLGERGVDTVSLWKEMQRMIVRTLICAQPLLSQTYRACQPYDPGNGMCFEILGFDIFLDHHLKPWLLEVNHSPSFTTDTPLDRNIKERVILDAISLLGILPENRERYYMQVKAQVQQRAVKGKDYQALRSERLNLQRQMMEERDKLEDKHTGGYRKIFPVPDDTQSQALLEGAQKLLYEQTTGKPKPHKEEGKVDPRPRTKPPVVPRIEAPAEEPTPRRPASKQQPQRSVRKAISVEPPKISIRENSTASRAKVEKAIATVKKIPQTSSKERLRLQTTGEFVKPKNVELEVRLATEGTARTQRR